MFKIEYKKSFKTDYKQVTKRRQSHLQIDVTIIKLIGDELSPEESIQLGIPGLSSRFKYYYVDIDWVLVYQRDTQRLLLETTGNRRDIFG